MKEIDYKAIAHWLATGFFENKNKSFFKNSNFSNYIGPDLKLHHNPRKITFEKALNEFGDLFESLIKKNIKGKRIVLPLSGGLDSRTIAAALKNKKNIVSYSYEFKNGISEIKYAQRIAEVCKWEFHPLIIKEGYLWDTIDELSKRNNCRTEFTHPRQMAFLNKISNFGDILLSGSNGDLLFESFSLKNNLNNNEQIAFLRKLFFKNSGEELASELWSYWKLDGNFNNSMNEILSDLIINTKIDNISNKMRAIKIESYVKNWTNINLDLYSTFIKTYAPYHDDEMNEFICSLPEEYLNGRKIQIEYLKLKSPELAKISWQDYDLNLYNYKKFNTYYFPKRIYNILKRTIQYKILRKEKPIQRNWELQFLSKKNAEKLEGWLFETPQLNYLIPEKIVLKYYMKFKKVNSVEYSHSVSMLLTLSLWCKENIK